MSLINSNNKEHTMFVFYGNQFYGSYAGWANMFMENNNSLPDGVFIYSKNQQVWYNSLGGIYPKSEVPAHIRLMASMVSA